MTGFRFCDEGDYGFGWIAEEKLRRASHALAADGRVWLVDPVEWPEAEDRARSLGDIAGVVQLLDRHNRDAAAIAQRLGIPHLRLGVPGPFARIDVVNIPRWREVALWWPARRILVCADALGTIDGYFTVPGEPIGVHPLLRLTPPRRLAARDPEHVLVGHGEGVHEAASGAVRDAVRTARRGLPSIVRAMIRR